MKKILAMILSVVMIASLTACGSKETPAVSTPAVSAPAASGAAVSQGDLNWPNDTITIYCGYSAGGSSDLCTRYMADALQKELGVSVIVENLPGSNSWLCWNQLLQTTPKDGNYLALVNAGIVNGKYDPTNPRQYGVDDFALLTGQVMDYEGIAIRIDEDRFSDLDSLIAYGKENPMFITTTAGYFSGDGAIARWLNKDYGTQIETIPVDGAGDQRTMFLAGDTDILIGNISDLTASGNGTEWKIMCTFSNERTKYTPDVPTAKEQGYEDYIGFSARGFAYANGVDERIVQKMQDAMIAVFENEDYQKNMEALGCNTELMLGEDWLDALKKNTQDKLDIWELGVTVE